MTSAILPSLCLYPSHRAGIAPEKIQVADLVDRIRAGVWASHQAAVRHAVGDDARRAAKINAPCMLAQARMGSAGRKRTDFSGLTGWLMIDIDEPGAAGPAALRDRMMDRPWIAAAWISISGRGVKAVAWGGEVDPEMDWKAATAWLAARHRAMGRALGVEIDGGMHAPSACCAMGHDPEAVMTEKEIIAFEIVKSQPVQPGTVAAPGLPEAWIPCPGHPISAAAAVMGTALAAGGRHYRRPGGGIIAYDPVIRALVPMSHRAMVGPAHDLISWKALDAKSNTVAAMPSADVVATIVEQDALLEKLTCVSSIATAPVMHEENGMLKIATSGVVGGVLVKAEGQPMPVMMDAGEAIRYIYDAFSDFDFASPGDRARAVAWLITPAMVMAGYRGMRPLMVSEADESQTGKSYLIDCCAAIYGERIRVITRQQGGTGSMDESIADALLGGARWVSIDNARGHMNSQTLEALITATGPVTLRRLRESGAYDPSAYAAIAMSSNNASLTKDLANRSCPVRLRKRPAGYRWRSWGQAGMSLLDHLRTDERGVSAVMSIAGMWHAAGRPVADVDTITGAIAGWAGAVDAAIQMADPGAASVAEGWAAFRDRSSDPDRAWMRDLARAMVEAGMGGVEVSPSEIAGLAVARGCRPPGADRESMTGHQGAMLVGAAIKRSMRGMHELTLDGFRIYDRSSANRPRYSVDKE